MNLHMDEGATVARPRQCIITKLESLDNTGLKSFLRMGRDDFDELLDLVCDDDVFDNTDDEQQDEPGAQLAVALTRLGCNGSGHILLRMFWDRSEGLSRTYIERGIQAVLGLQDTYLAWPARAQRQAHATRMAEKKFPGCVGFITETTITLPLDPMAEHRLQSHNVQVVCDMDGRIMMLFLGSSGRHVLCESPLWHHPSRYFSRGEYLLADATHPLSAITIPPYAGHDLTLDQTRFNARLDRVRKVKGCLALMKSRWSSVDYRPEFMSKKATEGDTVNAIEWISACAILHNFMHDRMRARGYRVPPVVDSTTVALLRYNTAEELRDCLVQLTRRAGRKAGGVAKRTGQSVERT
ncbi:unnamed protein product [Mortierella alpina]